MQIRQEDLIAFLLGDAEPELRRAIASALDENVELRVRLAQLQSILERLKGHRSHYEPPSGLLARTMKSIDQAGRGNPAERPQQPSVQLPAPQLPSPSPMRLSGSLAGPLGASSARRSFWDSAALSLSVAILGCLFLPTILRARFESRRIQCADNLRYLGEGLISLANFASDRRFPAVPVEGPAAFSGIYAVYLNEANLIDTSSRLMCAGVPRAVDNRPTTLELPSIAELKQALLCEQPRLPKWQRSAGGDYAYNLGVIESDQVVSPRSKGRTHFAILGDCPKVEYDRDEFIAHGRGALNVLFEDGHVEFVSVSAWQNGTLDHPFRNQDGRHEVGMHVNDASLAPSHFAPLGGRTAWNNTP